MAARSVSNGVDLLRVLICGPDLLARVGLATLMAAAVTVVGQTSPADLSAESLAAFQPDVILWDLGWEPQAQVAQLTDVSEAGYPIVALLSNPEAARGIKPSGVPGMLLRTSDNAVLVVALRAVACGLTVFDPMLTAFLFAPSSSSEEPYSSEPLTPREQEVLQSMAQGLSNKLIARHLNISEHTVKFHVNAILGKLGAQSRTEAVVRATRAGLIFL